MDWVNRSLLALLLGAALTIVAPWPLAMTAAFAGTLLTSLVLALISRRRKRRAERGECPGCGYDRRGLAVDAKCPECGTGSVRCGGG